MIASCIEKMRRDACGGCARQDICRSFFRKPAARADSAKQKAARRGARPGGGAHPFLALLGEFAKAIGEARETSGKPKPGIFAAQVEAEIEPLLELHDIGIERVARALGLSRQTLYRRLKAEGVTFEELLDRLRRRLARRLLREGLAVKEVAYRLGFSDPSAFSRAYKRWTGSSPRGPSVSRPLPRHPQPRSWSSASWQ